MNTTMNTMTAQSAIRMHLIQEGPCTLESLLTRLSQFSWSEIFSVVDQLSREGSLVLRRPARFGYEVSIPASTLSSESGRPGRAQTFLPLAQERRRALHKEGQP